MFTLLAILPLIAQAAPQYYYPTQATPATLPAGFGVVYPPPAAPSAPATPPVDPNVVYPPPAAQVTIPAGSDISLNVETGNMDHAGTHAPVYISFSDGTARARAFFNDPRFDGNTVQPLSIKASENMTTICEMTIGMSGPNGDDDNQWFVKRVTAFYQNQPFTFEVNDWLSYDSPEAKKFISVNNCPTKPTESTNPSITPKDTLEVQFQTIDEDAAGTHAPVFMGIVDKNHVASNHIFTDEFPKNSIIKQFIKPERNLEDICQITIGMAGPKGDNDNQWKLMRATIFKDGKSWTAFVNDWLSYDSNDAKKFVTVNLC